MEGYQTTILDISDLSDSTLKAMSRLYLSHYDGSSEQRFRTDLEGKSEALLVHHDRQLAGFTLYEIYRISWQGHTVRIIYSGDTIVDPFHWGQQALAFSWIARAGEIKRQEPDIPLYWFLIVKGHRTYRYLPTFSRVFHPHWAQSNEALEQLANHLATDRFPTHYNPNKGIIAYPSSQGHLKAAIAHPSEREIKKDAVRFFLQKNPDYLAGHELVCLCELGSDNLKPLARRLFDGISG